MLISHLLVALVRLLVGAIPHWLGVQPVRTQRIYFANHSSHIDTLAIWSALPPELRKVTHPVAAADYWGSGLRRHIALQGLNAVLVDRGGGQEADPLAPLCAALDKGDSLIIFPEGTRRAQALPGPFKSGLFHLAKRYPHVELVPVYLENLHRSMPKGTHFPVPLICTVRFGTAIKLEDHEDKAVFLERARKAVEELA